MSLTINLQDVKKYSSGLTDISDPWKDIPAKDIYTYEVFDTDNPIIKTSFNVVDVKNKEDYHIKYIKDFRRDIMNKFIICADIVIGIINLMCGQLILGVVMILLGFLLISVE